eukprot:scaffold126_cov315-Pavlova_lutheri.AAC.34
MDVKPSFPYVREGTSGTEGRGLPYPKPYKGHPGRSGCGWWWRCARAPEEVKDGQERDGLQRRPGVRIVRVPSFTPGRTWAGCAPTSHDRQGSQIEALRWVNPCLVLFDPRPSKAYRKRKRTCLLRPAPASPVPTSTTERAGIQPVSFVDRELHPTVSIGFTPCNGSRRGEGSGSMGCTDLSGHVHESLVPTQVRSELRMEGGGPEVSLSHRNGNLGRCIRLALTLHVGEVVFC